MAFLFLYFLVMWFWTLKAEFSSQAPINIISWDFKWFSLVFFFRFKSCRVEIQLSSDSVPKSWETNLLLVTLRVPDFFPNSLSNLFLLLDNGLKFEILIPVVLGIQENESEQFIISNWEFLLLFFLFGTKNLSRLIWVSSLSQPFLLRDSLLLKDVLFFLLWPLKDSTPA